MKNPFSFLNRKNLETSLGVLQTRFPIASLIVIILTGFLFYVVNAESDSMILMRIILSMIATFFLSIGVTLAFEGRKIVHQELWQFAPLIYGILFFVTMNPLTNDWMLDSITYFILHLVGFIGLLFFVPYWGNLFYKQEQSAQYTNYFSRVAWTLLMSLIVGGSLVALGFIAISSVVALFDLSTLVQESKLYGNWAILALSLVAPLYCLINLPEVFDVEKRHYEINRFFSFLIRYIATPFIVIYFIILYAYSAKVLLNFQDWPKGMISWMVVGFSSFGYLTYIFSIPYEEESSVISFFRKYFPYAVPAQILMLAYAIYLRIAQYDLTMNRYFVVIFGCWLALISLYYIVSQKKSLTIIAASLTSIVLIISVGPWSVYRLPLVRQYNHLVHNLTAAGMYRDGVVSKKDGILDAASENDIYSEIEYICEYSHCEKIKSLFAPQLAGKEEEYEKKWNESEYNTDSEYPGMNSWEIVNEVTTAIGISYRPTGLEYTSKYISLGGKNAYDETMLFPLDITGYNKILRVYSRDNQPTPTKKQYITINPDKETLTFYNSGTEKTISLKNFNNTLREKYPTSNLSLEVSDLTTMLELDGITIKLILQGYGFPNPEYKPGDSQNEYLNISGYALIK